MAKPEWGLKRACHGCGTRFYDLRRNPIVCPSCGATFDPLAMLRPRRSRAAAAVQEAKPPVVVAESVADVVEADVDEEVDDEVSLEAVAADDDEDEDVIEDVSELGEDGDDVSEVIEGGSVSAKDP